MDATRVVEIIIFAVIIGLVLTNPSGSSAVLGGVKDLSTGTIGAIYNTGRSK